MNKFLELNLLWRRNIFKKSQANLSKIENRINKVAVYNRGKREIT